MTRAKVKWPEKRRQRDCVFYQCKKPAMAGGTWCLDHLRESLEAARKLLATWRVLSPRQNAIVMAKINRTIEEHTLDDLEARHDDEERAEAERELRKQRRGDPLEASSEDE